VIIAPHDLTDYVPVCTAKDSDLVVTQFDGSVVEAAGMLKMDFLGLKTLSIIKDAIENVVRRYGEAARIDPDRIPLDDLKTLELFQKGETIGIFQFESPGMQKYLKELRPTHIEDLIAMNALYRPGPMDYIPSFVDRKHGREPIDYPHEWLEDTLKDTYGIMVYQEQIMQSAQVVAGYSLGQADILRRAMGKKKKEEMEKQYATFLAGALSKGVTEKQAREVFDIMEKFASYGFNRSHAAAYSVVAFQTAYLKAHYPAEFMASVLTHNQNNTEDITFFLSECKAQGLAVLGPDVNESAQDFTVNKEGKIRFGLSALKGIGEAPVGEILGARAKAGNFQSLGDFVRRSNMKVITKKCLENLAQSGSFDCFGLRRAQFFAHSPSEALPYIEVLSRYASSYFKNQNASTFSLFGEAGMSEMMSEPVPPNVPEWSLMEKLKKEKEITGFYLSGHPLNDYLIEYKRLATPIQNIEQMRGKEFAIAGVVVSLEHRTNAKGAGFGKLTIEDFEGNLPITLFSEDYLKFKNYMNPDAVLYIKGKYAESFREKGKYEFRVVDIKLLESVGKEKIKELSVEVKLEQLNPALISELDQLLTKYPGEQVLSITLRSVKQNIGLNYIAFERKIHIDSQLVQALERLQLKCAIS
jgi:DNA polymerase-3 subunit alpha